MAKTLILAANRGYALSSSRSGLIKYFLDNGWRVVIATADDSESRSLQGLGATLEPVTFNRGGFAPASDIRAYRRLVRIYREYQPDIIHHFHAKPLILGTIAARRVMGHSVTIVNTITGLGHAFITGGVVAKLAGLGYQLALPKCDATIFQNPDDRQLFLDNHWISPSKNRLITGSGIDVSHFDSANASPQPATPPMIVMLGRLLKQKGIPEFIDVATRIHSDNPEARFIWAGEADEAHPDAVSAEWMQSQQAIEYAGRLDDVVNLLREADILLFPSYREGIPRAVMEAAASGVPTIAFDVPGVRQVIIDGRTGYLVPEKDCESMAHRVSELLKDEGKRSRMGREARALAVEAFDRQTIEEQHLALYRELGVMI